ncbi:MAG TPA: VCBS repeat-containing protein [Kofleriaceae bacterium]|nr:VCBS repeat-containing protein [Kofleriaceae bacterium]
MRRAISALLLLGCGGGGGGVEPGTLGDTPIPLAAPACAPAAGGGGTAVATPELISTFADRWHEAWLGSPAVADLDGDGTPEILIARAGLLLGWHADDADGTEVFRAEVDGRIWASPVVADLDADHPGLEVAAAARGSVHVWGADGAELPGFPATWRDELRSLAAGDIDGDGQFELVAVTTSPLEGGGQRDIVMAWNLDGSQAAGFPANTGGTSGCDDACYVTGGYDQNIALGDVDGNDIVDLFATQDNAYLSLHDGTGRAFDCAPIFAERTKFLGVRGLHDYALAQQGWADDEATALQAHYTNSAPAIVDVDGDGDHELVVLASVQNASQDDRLKGVALWVLNDDATRPAAWVEPFHAPDYLAGLWDYDGTNVVAATNQVSVGELDAGHAGPEFVFAGFDGRIHCVDAAASEIWAHTYTTDDQVLTGGVALADLSGDGVPEVVFATYSPDPDKGQLVILSSAGVEEWAIPLPDRGAMPVPTVADADGDGALDIVVSLKGGEDGQPQALVYRVPG